jgi:hypothetical protein
VDEDCSFSDKSMACVELSSGRVYARGYRGIMKENALSAFVMDRLLRFHGEAVQVDPMTSDVKPPETNLLMLTYDEPLSSFTFEYNLRRYTMTCPC